MWWPICLKPWGIDIFLYFCSSMKEELNYRTICFNAMEVMKRASAYIREQHEARGNLNIEVKGEHNFVTEVDKRTEEILASVGLMEKRDRICGALSHGDQKVLEMAIALGTEPELLILDEPTNHLDVTSTQVMEQALIHFPGAVIVVSHDREFLDNVVTSTIVFEEDGRIQEYVGGYSDWARRGRQLAVTDDPFASGERKRRDAERRRQRPATKLSYKDQRELDGLPAEIEKLEAAIAALQTTVSEPARIGVDRLAATFAAFTASGVPNAGAPERMSTFEVNEP